MQTSQRHGTFRHNHRHPLDHAPVPLYQSTRFEPKNSHGQRALDGRLRFLVVHSHNGKRALPLAQPSARIGRTKGMFEIHAAGEPDHGPARKMPLERSAQTRFVGNTGRTARAGGALIARQKSSRSDDSAPCAGPAVAA